MDRKNRAGKSSLALSLNDLKGKQSVRTTFRLPGQVIELISVIAGQLGIKQKSLFDQLVEDVSVLSKVAEQARHYAGGDEERRQKTFVISRSSLLSLEYIAKAQHVPRDILVEVSIRRLLPLLESELEKHEKRKELLKQMNSHLESAKKLLANARSLLGDDDPVYRMIAQQTSLCQRNVEEVSALVEKGRAMESW